MRKQRVLSALVLSVCMLVTGTMSVLAKDTVEMDVPVEAVSLNVENITETYVKEFGLEQLDIMDMEVRTISSRSTSVLSRGVETVFEQEVGALVVESYDEECGLIETTCAILFDEDGEAMSSADLVSELVSTSSYMKPYACIQGKYLFAFEDISAIYVNPYQVSVTVTRPGIEYVGGKLQFHGAEVYADTLELAPDPDNDHDMPYIITEGWPGFSYGGYLYLEYITSSGEKEGFSFELINVAT